MQLILQVLNEGRVGGGGLGAAETATTGGQKTNDAFADVLSTGLVGEPLELPMAPVVGVAEPHSGHREFLPLPVENAEAVSTFAGTSDYALLPDLISTAAPVAASAAQHADRQPDDTEIPRSTPSTGQTTVVFKDREVPAIRPVASHTDGTQDQRPTQALQVSAPIVPGGSLQVEREARTEIMLPVKRDTVETVNPNAMFERPVALAGGASVRDAETSGLGQGRANRPMDTDMDAARTGMQPVAAGRNQRVATVADAATSAASPLSAPSAPQPEARVVLPSTASGTARNSGDIVIIRDRPAEQAPPSEITRRDAPDPKGEVDPRPKQAGSSPPESETNASRPVLAVERPPAKPERAAPPPEFVADRIGAVPAMAHVAQVAPSANIVQGSAVVVKTDPARAEVLGARDILAQSVEGAAAAGSFEAAEVRRSPEPGAPRLFDPPVRPVIAQIVQAAKPATEGIVEVRLSPEELGRVRLSMTAGETGMTVHVVTERPETLDLLRRHIEMLATDLHEQGFDDVDFSFGQDREFSRATDELPMNGDDGDPLAHDVIADGEIKARLAPDGRLDIRL